MTTTGPNVLATVNNQSTIQGYRPRLIEFYGYEGEDFRHFQEILDSYLAISNTHNDSKKLVILRSQLRRAAKVYFERVILEQNPDINYDKAMELLKKHYITPELIQSYELEFNEMYQGEQEHPQIFLARLREAADLANITTEELIQSRFRAGLLKEIKQFCIQNSAKTFGDWTNHAEGWWNANRPRKIAMVNNPFIPRNINNALIYQDDSAYHNPHGIRNHNIELIDTEERPTQIISVNDVRTNVKPEVLKTYPNVITGPNQLNAMEVIGHSSYSQPYIHQSTRTGGNQPSYQDSQHDLVNLIQQAIRDELNSQGLHNTYNRGNNRNNRGYYNNNYYNHQRNDNYDGYNNNRYSSNNSSNKNNHGRSEYNNQTSSQYRNNHNSQIAQPQQLQQPPSSRQHTQNSLPKN